VPPVNRRAPAAILITGWVLLTAAWVAGNPPFEAPDEADHYIRTVGVANGQVLGQPAPDEQFGATPRQIAATQQVTRLVDIPAGFDPPNCPRDANEPVKCVQPDKPPETKRLTVVGTYQPLPYLAPAAVLDAGDNPRQALRWGRVASALSGALFLALAAALLFLPGRVEPLLGLAVAVTPMVLFTSASLNPSGLEITSGIAFLAGLLRLTRADPPPPWAWVATGLAGGVLAASRSPGPVWVLLGLLLALALMGPRPAARRVGGGGWFVWAAGALLAGGIVANRIWEAAHGPETPVATFALRLGLDIGLDQVWAAAPHLVGRFGYLEYGLPLWIPLTWAAVLGVLGVLAWRTSAGRDRWVLGGVAVAAVVLPYLLWVLFTRDTGFGLQGRHVIVIVAAVPLLAGELLARRGRRLPAVGAAAMTAVLGLIHFIAFYLNGRRYAVGADGPLGFPGDAAWSPPLGWWPILILAALGALAVAAVGLLELRGSRVAGSPARHSPS